MASSISSSPFFPTTAPAYAPCRFSPAATYPPAPFPGGYHTSAFPYSGAYPYPPPADAYTPAHGLSPNRPNWPPPSPDPTLSTTTTTTSSTPTFSCVRFSPPPPAETSATASTRRRDRVPSATLHPARSSSPTPTSPPPPRQRVAPPRRKTTARPRATTALARPVRVTAPPADRDTSDELPDLAPRFELPDAYGPSPTEMETVPSASTAQQKNSSIASTLGSFSGATSGSSASSTIPAPTPFFGFTSSSVSTATSTISSRCSSGTSKSPSTATASVVPQMFGEMPTPLSEYENYCCGNPNAIQSSGVSTLNEQNLGPLFDAYDDDMDGCSTELVDVFLGTQEQQKSDQFTNCFCEALNAFSEDTPERVSHAYDVDTKGRTDESVHVFASPPERQSYEGEQQESGQLPKCFSKASEIVSPFQQPPMSATATDQMQFQASKSMPNYDVYEKEDSACINIISGVRDFTIELQQQNDERAGNCSVLKASNSFVSKSSQLNIEHSMRERRLLWDPGAAAYLMTPLNDGSSNAPVGNEHVGQLVSSTGDCFSHGTTKLWSEYRQQYIVLPRASASLDSNKSKPPEELSYVAMFVPKVLTLCIQAGSYEQQLRDSRWSVLVTHERRKEWDPGDTSLHFLFTTAAGATKLDYATIYKSAMASRYVLPQQCK